MKSDIDRLKAFITESVDKYRVPYGRTDTKIVRRTSFIATTNDDRFLIDPTGSRRFWTIPCYAPFDLDRLSRFNVGQLWKQIENEMSGLEYSTDYGSAFQNAFRLTSAERIALEARNQSCQKPIKAELEVRDILMPTEQTPVFAAARNNGKAVKSGAKGYAEFCVDSAPQSTWQA